MDSENLKRRDIIKNIAIVFLAAMLILTFFSNTIMNRTLPEVSAEYPSQGNVSETIRGSGTVEAEKSYEVTVDESRKIKAVNVKTGDTVKAGDVIYTLDGKESTELEEARKNLDTMEFEYRKALIAADGTSSYAAELLEIENAREDLSNAQRDLSRFDDDDYLRTKYASDYLTLKRAEEEIEQLTKQTEKSDYSYLSLTELETRAAETDQAAACLDTSDYTPLPSQWYEKVERASDKVTSLEKQKTESEGRRAEIEKRVTAAEGYIAALSTDDMLGLPTKYYQRIESALTAKNSAQTAYDSAKEEYDSVSEKIGSLTDVDSEIKAKQREIETKEAELDSLMNKYFYNFSSESSESSDSSSSDSGMDTINTLTREIRYLNEDLNELLSKKYTNSNLSSQLKSASDKKERTQTSLRKALRELNAVKAEIKADLISDLNAVKKELEDYDADPANRTTSYDSKPLEDAKRDLNIIKNQARADLRERKAMIEKCKELITKKQEYEKNSSDFRIKLLSDKEALEKSISEKKLTLEKLETALTEKRKSDSIENRKGDIELEEKQKQIADQRKNIEKLQSKAVGMTVTAPVNGIIRSLSYSEGENTVAGNSSAVIEMTDKGYKLTFSVKNEQAKKLKTGIEAEVANNYFGGDITATLVSIKTDTANPQTNKILQFQLTGEDIKAGDSITLTIGARGQEYACVIPNSALREDRNGKHVLTVESKSSPLGNRYYARRISVEVLAQNDTSAAVSGLAGGEFIITTSSLPIEAGKQVKLSESTQS